MKTMVQVELPHELLERVRQFVADGWAADLNEVLSEALQRFLCSDAPMATESFLREDVTWGLHGDD
jgi:hypothetical protein